MSELVSAQHDRSFRHLLLGGASAVALLTGMSASAALADDANHFYIELGGQYGIESGGSTDWFIPGGGEGGTLGGANSSTFTIRPTHSWNIDGAIKLQPADSDLIFKAGVQYGRTARKKKDVFLSYYPSYYYGTAYYTAHVSHKEEHVKVDFQVGKDFGLGMFGNNGGTSIFSVGVRYAQFNARTNVDFHTSTKYFEGTGAGRITRSFSGVGPMISWEASAPITDDGFSLDWGAEAAVLFGRQKVRLAVVYSSGSGYSTSRRNNKTVPEVGGFMGLSWVCPDSCAKITFGYKVDALFNLYDGGFLAHRDSDRITHGPFLKVGINTN